MPKFSGDQREHGDAIVARLADRKLAGDAKKSAAAFAATHAELVAASDAAIEARLARDGALAAVSNADRVLDQALQRLADKLVGDGLGKRANPFAAFGAPSPSELCALAYKKQVVEVRKLLRGVERARPRAPVVRAIDAVREANDQLEKALVRFARPQASYERALRVRDAILPTWQKSLDRTKILSRAALLDDPIAWKALFAPPGTKARRRRRKSPPSPQP